MSNIGVFGYGFVGKALVEGFKTHNIQIYDRFIEEYNTNVCFENAAGCEYIFLCLPTPARPDRSCDVSAVDYTVSLLADAGVSPLIIIKSTVPPGTANRIEDEYGLKIVSCPEFLVERTAKEDFVKPTRIVAGARDLNDARTVIQLHREAGISANSIICSNTDAELIKLLANGFLATKVSYFNMVYNLCEALGSDFTMVSCGITSDPRIGTSHSKVPGPNDKFGYGGHCFPKDMESLQHVLEELDLTDFIDSIIRFNKEQRDK